VLMSSSSGLWDAAFLDLAMTAVAIARTTVRRPGLPAARLGQILAVLGDGESGRAVTFILLG